MATLTPSEGWWVPIGHGFSEFNTQREEDRDADDIHSGAGYKSHQHSTPQKTMRLYSNGVIMPPPSEERKHAARLLRSSKASYSQYDKKLKVKDSKNYAMPRLVFRCYNADSQGHNSPTQIRAGLYKNNDSRIPPPYSGPKLKSAFLSHLAPEKKLSPFISTFESFLPALHRALRSDKEAFIAIIDLQKHEESAPRRFPRSAANVWALKRIVNQYNFKLKNGYKGYEWLVHGSIEKSAIVQTISVADLCEFARMGHVSNLSACFRYISQQPHAYALLKNLPTKLPKTNFTTGQLVGRVLDHVRIPKEYRVLVAKKINNMVRFKGWKNRSRIHAYLRGVCNFDSAESNSESDGIDVFVDSADEEYYDTDASYQESDDYRYVRGSKAQETSDNDSDAVSLSTQEEKGEDDDDEQALLDAQLHATEKEWTDKAPSPTRRTIRMSHIEVPTLTVAQRAEYEPVKPIPKIATIDLTDDADHESDTNQDTMRVQPGITEEDFTIIAVAKTANRSMNLAVRSTSVKSTTGPGGLARLEADAEMEVMEFMQFD